MKIIEHGGTRVAVDGFAVWTVGTPVPENLGRCYELSAQRVAIGPNGEHMLSGGYEGATLVHGTIQGVGTAPIGHAWVIEPDGTVWEPASAEQYPADVFAALFAAVPLVQYDATEARIQMVSTQHYGPWADEAVA